jgi:hypothetical protein
LGRNETAGEIIFRNRELFQTKWRGIARRTSSKIGFLQSGWREYGFAVARQFFQDGNIRDAAEISNLLIALYPDDGEIIVFHRLIRVQLIKYQTKESE